LKPLRQFPYKIFPCRYVAAQSVISTSANSPSGMTQSMATGR